MRKREKAVLWVLGAVALFVLLAFLLLQPIRFSWAYSRAFRQSGMDAYARLVTLLREDVAARGEDQGSYWIIEKDGRTRISRIGDETPVRHEEEMLACLAAAEALPFPMRGGIEDIHVYPEQVVFYTHEGFERIYCMDRVLDMPRLSGREHESRDDRVDLFRRMYWLSPRWYYVWYSMY